MKTMVYHRWRKMQEAEKFLGETFLRGFEKYCVTACDRYRHLNFLEDGAWLFESAGTQAQAMLLHSRYTIFPLFNGITQLTMPPHLYRALSALRIHALHGLRSDVELLLNTLSHLKANITETIEYHLMALDGIDDLQKVKTPPAGLLLRRPKLSDAETLLPLQLAYEQEEVLPYGALIDSKNAALNLARIITKEHALVAEIDGVIVGKINTNAQAYSRCQIGGVYVLPEYRGKGIAASMTAAFARLLLNAGFGMTLFVKKTNTAALRTYFAAGFKTMTDYSIVYC